MTRPTYCAASASCKSYAPGHRLHAIHARLIGETPWAWRDAVVRSIDADNIAVLKYDADGGTRRVWHHHDLSIMCPPGSRVKLREFRHALAFAGVVLNVDVIGGAGPGAAPEHSSHVSGPVIVTDLTTGQGVTDG